MNRYRFMPFAPLLAAFALVIGFCSAPPAQSQAIPSLGPITQTFTTPGSPGIRFGPLTGQNSGTFQSTGAGPTDVQVSNDGFTWTNTQLFTMAGVTESQPFTPTSGVTYQFGPTNAVYVQIVPDSTWNGQTATVTGWLSGSNSNSGSGGGGSGQTVVCASPGCVIASLPPISGTVSNNCVTNCTPPPIATMAPLFGIALPVGFPWPSLRTSCIYIFLLLERRCWVPVTSTAALP